MPNNSPVKVTLAIIAIVLYSGLIGTVVGMSKAFSKLSITGQADPSELAGDISFALLTMLWGLAFVIVGFVMILISHFKLDFRATWFYWSAIILSVFNILVFPIGSILGGVIFYVFYRSRQSYFKAQSRDLKVK